MILSKMVCAATTGKDDSEAVDGNPTPSTNYSRNPLNFKVMKKSRSFKVEYSHLDESLNKHVAKL